MCSCALQRDLLLQGRLYISPNWLCFHASLFGKDIKVVISGKGCHSPGKRNPCPADMLQARPVPLHLAPGESSHCEASQLVSREVATPLLNRGSYLDSTSCMKSSLPNYSACGYLQNAFRITVGSHIYRGYNVARWWLRELCYWRMGFTRAHPLLPG